METTVPEKDSESVVPEKSSHRPAGIPTTKRNRFVAVVVVAALALMFWAGWANYESRKQAQEKHVAALIHDQLVQPEIAQPADEQMPTTFDGKPAPEFTLSDISGRKVSLADYKGKAVLLNFWATWCGPCKVEIPWILKLREQYAGKGFEVLGVSSDDLDKGDKKLLAQETADIAKFAKDQSISYPVLIDGDSISHPYGGVDSLPTSFYIDRKGTIVAQTIGLVSRDEMEANIKKALGSQGE
jgi:cytochrome c biogenesis protein CcmG/thiol:disulfide interchange protein DsbE